MADRTVSVSLIAKVQGFIAPLATARKSMGDFSGELGTLANKHKESFSKITTVTGAMGLGLMAAFGGIVKSAADFDKQMSAVGAVADTSGKGLDSLRQAALKAGKDTAYSATQAAQAEEELAKAGISSANILGGALSGSLSLAAAGQMDLANAATISAQAMNVWHLSGAAVPHIADVLAASANKSAADMQGMGLAIKQGGLVANQFGLTLEDTVGTLSAFADRALVGSDAGTSLKTMLMALANATPGATKTMEQLGIHAYDAQGKFVGVVALAGQLKTQLSGLTQAERDHALAQIFGSDAMRAANVLYTQGADGIQGYIDGVNESGAASRTAAEKMNNLAGDAEQLKGSLETLAIQSGSGTNAGLRTLTQGATGLINVMLGLPGPVQQAATILLGVSGASLLAASGFLKVRATATEAMTALRDAGPVGGRVADGLAKLGKVGGAVGIAAVATFGLYEGLTSLSAWAEKGSQPVHRDIDQLTKDLSKFADSGIAAGEMAKAFGSDLGQLGRDFDAVALSSKSLHDIARDMDPNTFSPADLYAAQHRAAVEGKKALSDIGALDQALAQLATNGGATQAKIAFDKITASLLTQGVPLDQINAMFGKYQAAAGDAATAAGPLARGFGDVSANTLTMNKGLQDAINHGQTLTDVFKQLNGAALDFLAGEIAVKQDLADLKDKFVKGKDAINDNTQAGRDNLKMIGATIQDAAKAAQAKLDESGSVQAATDTYNGYIEQLRKTLRAAGLTEGQVNDLINTYAKMPPSVSTQVESLGVDAAKTKVLSYKQVLDDLNGKVVTTYVTVDTSTGQQQTHRSTKGFNRWGGLYEHAQDGLLRQAQVYSATNPGRYVIAEPATGGEAFVPRNGDYLRSTAILDQASRWYGGRFMAGGGGSGTAAPVVNVSAPRVTVMIGEEDITSRVHVIVQQHDAGTAAAVSGGVRY